MDFDKYEKFGDYHWKEYLLDTPYRNHANRVKNWVRGGDTFDIGAGDGLITHLLGAAGIDNNITAIQLANKHGVNVMCGDIYDLSRYTTYDNIYLGDVIEHLEFPDKGLAEIKTVMKCDGLLYIVTPPAKKNGLHDPYHYREYTSQELEKYMKSQGFTLIGNIEVIKNNVRMYGVWSL